MSENITYVSVEQTLLFKAQCDLRRGLEYAQQVLSEHDLALGRTTLKNRVWAQQIEKDIANMTETIANLEERNPTQSATE